MGVNHFGDVLTILEREIKHSGLFGFMIGCMQDEFGIIS
jgi:hypothetical protein